MLNKVLYIINRVTRLKMSFTQYFECYEKSYQHKDMHVLKILTQGQKNNTQGIRILSKMYINKIMTCNNNY